MTEPEVFDVEVSTAEVSARSGASSPRPRGRRTAAVVVAAAVVGAAVLVATGALGSDDDEAAATTTISPGAIEPPPTLPPTTTTAPADVTPGTTGELRRADLLPVLDPVDTTLTASLADAVRVHGLDRPIRTATEVTIGERGFAMTVLLDADPESGLLQVRRLVGEDAQLTIIDPTQYEGYVLIEPNVWSSYPLTDAEPDIWRRLVLGPLDSDLLFRSTALRSVQESDTVRYLDADGAPQVGRVFVVSTTVDALADWAPYALGPVGEAPPIADATSVDLRVIVGPEGHLAGIDWAVPFGNTVQVVSHRFVYPDEVEVDLPQIGTL